VKINKMIIAPAAALTVITGVTLYFEVFRYMGGRKDVIEGNGTIEVTEIEISPRLSGRIVEMTRDEGDRVRMGELLVRLAYQDLDAQRLSAKASLVNAEKNLVRARELGSTGSMAAKELDAAEAAYRVARGQYEYIEARIDDARLFSPMEGIVLERNREPGEMAFPGTSVMTLGDLSKPWIRIYVPENRIGRVSRGQKAYVYVDSFPGRKFNGRVVAISNKAEFTPRTIQTKEERVKLVFGVKIALENQGGELKPGMPADAVILVGDSRD